MVTYSEWRRSQDQQKYYGAVFDDDGELVDYKWEGGYRQYVQPTRPPGEVSSYPEEEEEIKRLRVTIAGKVTRGEDSGAEESRWFSEKDWGGPKVTPPKPIRAPKRQLPESTSVARVLKHQKSKTQKELSLKHKFLTDDDAAGDMKPPKDRYEEAAKPCLEALDFCYQASQGKHVTSENRGFIESQRSRFRIWHSLFLKEQELHVGKVDMVEGILKQLASKVQSFSDTYNGAASTQYHEGGKSKAACVLDFSSDSGSEIDEETHEPHGDTSAENIGRLKSQLFSREPHRASLAASVDRLISRLYRLNVLAQEPELDAKGRFIRAQFATSSRSSLSDASLGELILQECPKLKSTLLQNRIAEKIKSRRAKFGIPPKSVINQLEPATLFITYEPTQREIARWKGLRFPEPPRELKDKGATLCSYCWKHLTVQQTGNGLSAIVAAWRWHILQDMQPTTCLASECEDVVSWPDIAPWLEHLGNRHYPRYYCQFPGHENLWFSSVTELESHLEGSHSSSVTSTMASIFATKGKHSPPDPLFSMLRTDWNRDENERHNFIACPLCGIRVLNMKEMSWDALVEIKGFDIDHTRSEYRDKLPPHTRGHILDHLTRHFEALSLLSLWNLDIAPSEPTLPSNKGSTVLTLRSKPKESPLGEPFVPTRKFEATISDWIQCPDTNKTYRWKCNSEGQLQYQWQTQHDRRVNQQMMQQATQRSYETETAPKPPVTYPMEPRTVPVTSDQSSSLHAPQSTGVVASMVDPSTRQEWRHIENDSEPTAYENRHPAFQRVSVRERDRFFMPGRVFKILVDVPIPDLKNDSTRSSLTRFNEGTCSEIRRFVVVQSKGTCSQCLRIQPYHRQAVTKPGLFVSDHGPIYTGDDTSAAPQLLPGEKPMTKMALRVKPSGSEYLHATSRVNYSQPYAIEHNVKLAEIGVVVAEHVQLLLHYFVTAMGSLPIEDVEVARADQDDD